MNSKLLVRGFGKVGKAIVDHKSTGLTIANMALTLLAVYNAVKYGPALKQKYEDAKAEGKTTAQAVKETVLTKEAAAIGAPAIGAMVSVGYLNKVTGDTIRNLTDNVSVAMASKEAFTKAAEEVVGKEKVDEIRKKVAVESAPGGYGSEVHKKKIQATGHGDYLFYFEDWDLWLYSNINHVRKVTIDYDQMLQHEGFISSSEYLMQLGVSPDVANTSAKRRLGWDMSHRIEIGDTLDVRVDDCDLPYYHIRFRYPPTDSWKPLHDIPFGR